MCPLEDNEPHIRDNSQDETLRQPREHAGRTPDKAEGNEGTIEKALENQEEKKRR